MAGGQRGYGGGPKRFIKTSCSRRKRFLLWALNLGFAPADWLPEPKRSGLIAPINSADFAGGSASF